jgi:ankyrin repeat protein
LQNCFPPNLRQFLNELPDTLDETYEQMLKSISKAQKDDAYRLLQCLAVAVRPLHVEELAELLAFDFQSTSSGGIPNLKADWRWDDHEEAVLSTCSSLITIVRDGDSRVVQFSHFSVKEYLTSPRLARSGGDVSRFYIDLEPAHAIMVQACLGTLLRLDEHAVNSDAQQFPLVEYAARHWVDHARFEMVSSRVRDGMDDLFDTSKPHFATWLRMHDLDEDLVNFSFGELHDSGSPLYYAAFCGLYGLTERLIEKHPEQVNAVGGRIVAPLPAALHGRHFQVADLLLRHGAAVDVRGLHGRTLLHRASMHGQVDVMRWLLNHGADVHSRQSDLWTPLHLAAANYQPEVVQVLLDHKADINSRNEEGNPPLHEAFFYIGFPDEKRAAGVVRRLLEHGADPNTHDDNDTNSTPLHIASSKGWLEVARLLLSHGANVDEKDKEGRTSFQVASSKGHVEMTKLLLDHGANPEP